MSADLKWSINNGDLDQVKQIIEKDKKLVNCEITGRNPIHFAADFGQNEVLAYLLTQGADINAMDSYGITPLLSAIFEGHVSTVKLLLTKGAKRDLQSPDGRKYTECAETSEMKQVLTA